MNVPFCDLERAYAVQREELDAACRQVLESGWYILGRNVTAFEEEFAAWCGAPHCVGVASGTDAVELALRGVGVGPGDKVATVSHTAVATVAAIERLGAEPVLVDVEPRRFTMSPESLERLLQAQQIRAVVPVHLYGHCADMDRLLPLARERGCAVVEDCAQAHGARWHGQRAGSLGDAAAFSFYPTKNLGAFGDGGAVLLSNGTAAEQVRALRQYGWHERYVSREAGCNSRLDEMQAAFLRVRLTRLEADNERRRQAAARYLAALSDLPDLDLPQVDPVCEPVWHLFVVATDRRDELVAWLKEQGVGTAIQYPLPVHEQPAYAGRLQLDPAGLPHTEALCRRILSLPMHAHIRDDEVDRVCEAVHAFFKK